jgi:membrane-associated protein
MSFIEPRDLIEAVGHIGLFFIVFAETGLLIGFFLPGDSLLFTAGFLASQDILNIWLVVPGCFIAAVVGDATGYAIGHRMGRTLFTKPESRLFKPDRLLQAEAFFKKHGGKAIILARFVPFARTFVPVIAGIGTMPYRSFAAYNAVGAVLWAIGLPTAGYFLGKSIPEVDRYLLPVIALIIFVSLIPPAIEIWRSEQDRIKTIVRERSLRALRSETNQPIGEKIPQAAQRVPSTPRPDSD